MSTFGNLVRKHLVAIGASMAGGAVAGGAIILALTSGAPSPQPTHIAAPVAEVASPSPADSPRPTPTDAPSPSAEPTAAPTTAPAPAAPAATAAPAPPPPPSCPTGTVVLSQSGTGRWDGAFTVPALCSTYTYRWTYGPVPDSCSTWTLAFYADVNGQGPEYTQAGPRSGGGSVSHPNPGGRVASEVNLYNGCAAVPWTVTVTAG